MGRVADALTKAFPTRDERAEPAPAEDPWQLAEAPDTVETRHDAAAPPGASKPQVASAQVPPAAPAPRLAPVPRVAAGPHAAPSPQIAATPHDTPLAIVVPRPKAQPTETRATDAVKRHSEDPRLLREVTLSAREDSPSADPRYHGKLVGDAELSLGIREQFRSLATALFHSARQTGTRILLVSSALPGEGKTLVSSNVAETLSSSFGLRVLLIDVDLRRPSVHSVFDLPPSPGLAESLESDLETAVPAIKISPKLSVVVAGQPPHDPMKIVAGSAMQRLLQQAASQFDWVILDSPPLGLVSDAALVAALADKVLVVVKAGETPYPAVMDVLKNLGPDRVLGVVLNQVEESAADPYGYASQGYYASAGEPERQSE